jgi:hypothetical protein
MTTVLLCFSVPQFSFLSLSLVILATKILSKMFSFWLFLMTVNNIGVTIINKALFANIHFPYPYMLTVIHMGINYLACHYIFYTIQQSRIRSNNNNSQDSNSSNDNGKTKTNIWIQLLGDDVSPPSSSTLTKSSSSSMMVVMILYSMLFSMNIAIGNVSLQYVSINFNQVMRSLVPIIALFCTYLMNYCLYQKQYQQSDDKQKSQIPIISLQRQIAVYLVVFGVIVSTIGDRMSYTVVGLIYTLLCVVLAALKVVVSSELLSTTRYPQFKMHPLRLLHRMAPLAFGQCLIMSIITGEFQIIRQRWYIDLDPFTTGNIVPILVLIISGTLAFSLNICALQAYKVTSPITCCIAAAVKQVLMVWIGTAMFHTPITPLNGCGIVIVLFSSTYYSYISITEPKVIHINTNSSNNHNDNNNDSVTSSPSLSETIRPNTSDSSADADHVNAGNMNQMDDNKNQADVEEILDLHQPPSTSNYDDEDTIELGVPLLRRAGSNNGHITIN